MAGSGDGSNEADVVSRCYSFDAGLGRSGSWGLPESAPPWRRRKVVFRVLSRQPSAVRT